MREIHHVPENMVRGSRGSLNAEQKGWCLHFLCREGALLASVFKPPGALLIDVPFQPSACGRGVVNSLRAPHRRENRKSRKEVELSELKGRQAFPPLGCLLCPALGTSGQHRL